MLVIGLNYFILKYTEELPEYTLDTFKAEIVGMGKNHKINLGNRAAKVGSFGLQTSTTIALTYHASADHVSVAFPSPCLFNHSTHCRSEFADSIQTTGKHLICLRDI